ncbi:DUF1501 domain-containing protein [Niveibacterium umoris]|uniref:Uncharacterized protein (DUF1501 family) n=1 Tax=Niveibacterium umoris TaxID=1193620 RepID=A0A840BKF9_9RHOO|nr:DUF1501 domain-containing protein [Niveibacterium umoris]MBB4012904.1 uncharacterized protein (DUF1501 family) [Niveibacterium umoris]
MSHNNASRRDFLKRAAALSALGGAAPFALNLAGVGAAAAATDPGYKALVCLFFFGGNDQTNTVIPYDSASYNDYYTARDTIARLQTALLPLNPLTSLGGRQLALPTEMSALKALFDGGKAAILANVGPLVAPIKDATEYKSGKVPVPAKLFSHNDQTSTWQAFTPEGSKLGWGGRFGDLLGSMNTNSVFTAISAAGNTVFLTGQNTFQYQISSGGAVGINNIAASSLFGSTAGAAALKAVTTGNSAQLFEKEHGRVVQRSIDAQAAVSAALTTLPTTDTRVALPTAQANNNLAKQLQIVARLAGVSAALGVKRQVFFVSIGGFDTHDNQLTTQPGLHASISGAVDYFYNATVQLGIANNVTLFTASDFGRTLTSNGDGSDHGWGSHHFIVGGAVKGNDIYGTFPTIKLGTPEDVGSGRLLPTTSVDQYAATLGRWFGVSDSDLSTILPNIGRFSTRYLNFI